MTPRALSVEHYGFQPGDELFLDANIWLFIFGSQNPGNARTHVYSSAFRRILEAKSRIYFILMSLSLRNSLTPMPDCSGASVHPARSSRRFATARILGRLLGK